MQVTATDGDKDRPENIVYFLTGQGIDTDRPDQSKFDINKTTGEIFVLKVTSGDISIYIYLYLHYVPTGCCSPRRNNPVTLGTFAAPAQYCQPRTQY